MRFLGHRSEVGPNKSVKRTRVTAVRLPMRWAE